MRKRFKFVLSDELREKALHSADTVFNAEKHESINDLYCIWWEEDEGFGVNNYLDKDVEKYVKKGDWVIVD